MDFEKYSKQRFESSDAASARQLADDLQDDVVKEIHGAVYEAFLKVIEYTIGGVMKLRMLFLSSTIVVALAAAGVNFLLTPTMAMQQSQERISAPKSIIGATGVMAFIVKTVEPGSAAEQAGLKAGDLVTDLDGQINSIEEFQKRIWQSEPGTTFRITYLRFTSATGELEEHQTTIRTKAFGPSGKTSGS